jgi:hypothetical protein
MRFLKYEFTATQWKTAKAKIELTDEDGNTSWDPEKVAAVVELGKLIKTPATYDEEGNELTPATYASKISVDILWAGESLTTSFASYVVWPEPCGIHTFAGWEVHYTEEYYKLFPRPAVDYGEE